MKLLNTIVATLIVVLVFLHTISYGKWNWNKKNYPGALVVFFIAFVEMVLPLYLIYIRQ
jgi:hypothetical protein